MKKILLALFVTCLLSACMGTENLVALSVREGDHLVQVHSRDGFGIYDVFVVVKEIPSGKRILDQKIVSGMDMAYDIFKCISHAEQDASGVSIIVRIPESVTPVEFRLPNGKYLRTRKE